MIRRLVLLLLLVTPLSAAAADWPQFLGPTRNGISPETGLLDQWPSGGPPVKWRIPGGVGMSSVAVKGGLAVTALQSGGRQRLAAYDAATGKQKWTADLGPEYGNQMGDGPRATPLLDADTAYFFTGEGVLVAVSLADGKQRGGREPLAEHNGRAADYGMASSPLLAGDLVVVIAGAPRATVVAYNRRTGEPAWAAGNDAAGYASPNLLNLGGTPQVVAFTGRSCLGLDPRSGKQLWRYPFKTQYECNTASPIAVGGQLFLSAGESHGAVLLEIKPSAEPREVWSSLGPRGVMKNEWQTSVFLDGFLYGLDNVGSAGPVTHLACIEAKTGKPAWQQPRFGKSNFIAADGKLWFSTMKGELVVVRASSKGYDELGRVKVLGRTRQSPTLANGLLYLRDDREIVCLDVRRP